MARVMSAGNMISMMWGVLASSDSGWLTGETILASGGKR